MGQTEKTQSCGRRIVVRAAAAGHPMGAEYWEATGIVPLGMKRRRSAATRWRGVRLSAVVVKPPGV